MIEKAPPSKVMSYEEAILYCQFLEYNGHRDWRMPTSSEYLDTTGLSGWFVDRKGGFNTRNVTPVRTV
jgi:hypothetical protein